MNLKMLTVSIFLLIACCIIPASAIGLSDYSQESDTKHIITPWYDYSNASKAPPIYGDIGNGEIDTNIYQIPSGKTRLETAISWSNPQNSLCLTITRPDGHTYGPFYDSYNGVINGVIPILITGNIANGQWTISIYGQSISGIQPYTLQFNAVQNK